MKPGGGKIKGAIGERELASLLTLWGTEVGMGLALQRNLDQVRDGGHDLTGLEDWGLAVECKRHETLSINAWWGQAVRQGVKAKAIPVLAYRQNRKPWKFRIRAWAWPCAQQLDIDMEADEFKKWFQSVITRPPIGGDK